MLRLLTPVELSVVRSWTGFKPNGSSESDQKLFVLGHDMRISSEGIPRIPGLNRALVESIYFTEYRCQNTGAMHLTMHLTEEARLFSMPPPASSAGIHNV
jgi:hypothetical protein